MVDGTPFNPSSGYVALSNDFPVLDELFAACKRNVAAVDDGDYLLDSSFRENYQRYNVNRGAYVNLNIFSFSAIIERSSGSVVVVASQPFREASEAVPYFNALDKYKRVLISCLNDCGYQKKREIDALLAEIKDPGYLDGSKLGVPYDKDGFLLSFKKSIQERHQNYSAEEVGVAAGRVFKFMTDYGWWGGAKCLSRDDYFLSPILSILGKAAASSEIYAFIVRDYAADDALYKSSRNLALVDRVKSESQWSAQDSPERLKTGANIMIYGAPGTGKSWFIKHELYKNAVLKRTVFHPEYSYFDFVGTYKPVPVYIATENRILSSDGADAPLPGSPAINYGFVPGPFVDAVIDAFDDPTTEYCLVIEEINRASAAAVFGDMFQLLDRQENRQSEFTITPQADLATYLRSTGHEELASSFYIPSNLSIAATMNNADLGVTYLDTAFKRRWSFTYIPIDLAKNSNLQEHVSYNGATYSLLEVITAINDKLYSLRINEDRWIGPYFVSPQEVRARGVKEALKKIAMYLWDDVFRNDRSRFFDPVLDSLSAVERAIDDGDPLLLEELLNSQFKSMQTIEGEELESIDSDIQAEE